MIISTKVFQKTVVAIFLALQTTEFTIYIWFFFYRYKHDNGNIAKLLSQETVEERNVKNVTTFVGQMYTYLVECAFLVANIVFIQFGSQYHVDIMAIIVFLKVFSFGVLSVVEVITSPGLRKSMKY